MRFMRCSCCIQYSHIVATVSAMLSLFQCWLVLLGCIVSEVTGSVCLKLSDEYKNLLPSIFVFVFFSLAFAGFPFALSRIDLGTAYAVWSGVGTCATALVGIVYFHEKATTLKLLGVAVIILGVILLNISEANEESTKQDTAMTETSTLVGVSLHVTNGGSV